MCFSNIFEYILWQGKLILSLNFFQRCALGKPREHFHYNKFKISLGHCHMPDSSLKGLWITFTCSNFFKIIHPLRTVFLRICLGQNTQCLYNHSERKSLWLPACERMKPLTAYCRMKIYQSQVPREQWRSWTRVTSVQLLPDGVNCKRKKRLKSRAEMATFLLDH